MEDTFFILKFDIKIIDKSNESNEGIERTFLIINKLKRIYSQGDLTFKGSIFGLVTIEFTRCSMVASNKTFSNIPRNIGLFATAKGK